MTNSPDFSTNELRIVLLLGEQDTLRAVARSLATTPGNVSKILQKLEAKLGYKLFWRSTTGSALTPEGQHFAAHARQILSLTDSLTNGRGAVPREQPYTETVTLGATVLLNTHVVGPSLKGISAALPGTRLRLIDFAPDALLAGAMSGSLDLAVYIGQLEWPKTWTVVALGAMRWGLITREGHPLGGSTGEKRLQEYSFVVPSYWHGKQFVQGNDYCPLPWSSRTIGYEVSSATAAAAVVRTTDQVGFLPLALLQKNSGLRHVTVKEWDVVDRPVFMAVKADRVSVKLKRAFTEHLKLS